MSQLSSYLWWSNTRHNVDYSVFLRGISGMPKWRRLVWISWTGLSKSALQPWIGTMLVCHHLILDAIHIRHPIVDEFLTRKHWIMLLQSLFTLWTRKKQLDFTHGWHVGEKQTRGLFSWATINTIEESDSYYPRSASLIFIWSDLRLETVQSLGFDHFGRKSDLFPLSLHKRVSRR